MALQSIADGLWHATSDISMMGIHFPIRMTVIRLADDSLLLYSPIAINDALAKSIDEQGAVKHILAPATFHHVHVAATKARYPQARLYCVTTLDKKRKDIAWDEVLSPGSPLPAAFEGTLDMAVMHAGSRLCEVDLLHIASRTLIVADLCMHIRHSSRWYSRMFLKMVRVYGKLAQSLLWRISTQDKQRVAATARLITRWDFDRLVMAHGEIVETGAKERLPDVLKWMLSHAPALSD